jgi:hypothetical protein
LSGPKKELRSQSEKEDERLRLEDEMTREAGGLLTVEREIRPLRFGSYRLAENPLAFP